MQCVGGDSPEQVAMYVHGGKRRVAVFRQAGSVETGYGNIFGNAASPLQQSFDNADGGEVIHRDDRGRPRFELSYGKASLEAAVEAQISLENRTRF